VAHLSADVAIIFYYYFNDFLYIYIKKKTGVAAPHLGQWGGFLKPFMIFIQTTESTS
jgi:hypothetical protein